MIKMETTLNKYYNYMLLDPRKPYKWNYKGIQISYLPFYVGKGSNSRVSDHYRNSCSDNPYTKKKIKKLQDGGYFPNYIIYNELVSAEEAYKEETNTIQYIKGTFGDILTNMTTGGDAPPVRYGKDNNKSIPVYQYSTKGDFIAEFESARDAALKLGHTTYTHICQCCKNLRKTALGYIWRYDKHDKIDVKKEKWDRITFETLIAYNETEYHEFSSMKDAYTFLGVKNKGKINSVLKGDKKTFMGFYWKTK